MMNKISDEQKRSKVIKYVRHNSYRITLKVWIFLTLSSGLMYLIGSHFHVFMLTAAMLFLTTAFALCLFPVILAVEMYVVKIKKYKDSEISKLYFKIIEIEKQNIVV